MESTLAGRTNSSAEWVASAVPSSAFAWRKTRPLRWERMEAIHGPAPVSPCQLAVSADAPSQTAPT